jgi:hypothetical protein
MKRKPDILVVLAVVFCLGIAVTSYLPDNNSPELVAQQLLKK